MTVMDERRCVRCVRCVVSEVEREVRPRRGGDEAVTRHERKETMREEHKRCDEESGKNKEMITFSTHPHKRSRSESNGRYVRHASVSAVRVGKNNELK